jgi:signal recognition particle receptor subunit beta
MAQLDFQRRELALKLVYYGPALSGKTTNLSQIHQRIDERSRGRLMTLDTRDDRTLFFDLLPIAFRPGGELKIKLKLFTVPGQVIHESTRKIVLSGADGVAFIADSRRGELLANNDCFAALKANLREQSIDPADFPIVIQFNKRDLPDVCSDEELAAMAASGPEPTYKAVALRGEGVLPTFFGLLALTWQSLDRRYDLSGKFGIERAGFMEAVVRELGARPDERGDPSRRERG